MKNVYYVLSEIYLRVHHTLKGNLTEEKSFVFARLLVWHFSFPTYTENRIQQISIHGIMIYVSIWWWCNLREEDYCILGPAEVHLCFWELYGKQSLLVAGFLLSLRFTPEDRDSMFLRNIGQFLPDNMGLYPKRQSPVFIVTSVRTWNSI